jgi:hypothetical protein
MSLTMRNDNLLKKRFDTLKSEAYAKFADDPEMAKQIVASLSTTTSVLTSIWAEFFGAFKYETSWIMSTMDKVTPFIKSFANERLTNVALQDLPNDVITLFVILETNRIEIIIGTTSVATIKIVDSIVRINFNKEKKFELSDFVEEHVTSALVKINQLKQMLADATKNTSNDETEDESDE